MKSKLLILLLLMTSVISAQEKIAKLARAGGKGIFVFCSDRIPKETSTLRGFRIERKSDKEVAFKKVAELDAVKSFKEFKKNFYETAEWFPYPAELDIFKLDTLWNISNRNPTINGLGVAGSSIPVLAGFNMVWLDKDVKPGVTYEYRVIGTNEPILESAPVTFGKAIAGMGLIFRKAAFDQTNNEVLVDLYSADKNRPVYIQTWRSENKAPFAVAPSAFSFVPRRDTVEYRITDTTVTAYQVYHYAFKSWDVYGNPFPVSDTLFITALDYLQMPLPNKIKAVGDSTGKSIKITWNQQASGAIKMMTLYRSRNSVNNFEPVAVLAADQKIYIDEQVEPATSYFYYFEVVFKTSDSPKRTASFASSFYDKSLPGIPQYLEAVNKGNGILISWQYAGSDTKGFNLYRTQSSLKGEKFRVLLGRIPVGRNEVYTYYDNDSTLLGDRFYDYFATAISTSDIEGLPSDTASARPGFNVPVPAAPLNIKAAALNGNIFVSWEDVSANNSQVSAYLLLKTNDKTNKTDTIPCGINHYNDTTAVSEINYSYKVMSLSDMGIKSLPSASATATVKGFTPAPPSSLTASKEKNGINLRWELPDQGEQFNYEIYRYQRGSEAQKAGAVKAGESRFSDRNVEEGQMYFYYVKSVSPNQIKSSGSKEVGIAY